MTDNYNILINKLDEFIRKYYKNQLVKGIIYTITILLLFYIAVNILEYFAHFGIAVRTTIFYTYLIINIIILLKYIIIPLSKIYKIGKIISKEQASKIIGKHFPKVKDKLLNTLQLKQLQDNNLQNKELIQASINQKISKLRPIPFSSAIDLSKNKKYIKYTFIPLLFLIIVLFTAPSLFTESTKRLIKYNEFFEKKASFKFIVLNKKLEAIQQDDFQLDVKLIGDEIPENIYIKTNNVQYKMSKENTILFHYKFNNIQKNQTFQFFAENYYSKIYELTVFPKPIILNFEAALIYPKYIKKKNDVLENTGDLIIPCGTRVNWKFFTKDTKNIILKFKDKTHNIKKESSNAFKFSGVFLKNQTYSIKTLNKYITNKDSLAYSIKVIPDEYPIIKVEEYRDSLYDNNFYFKGIIKDDYGFKKLIFCYKKLSDKESTDSTDKIFLDKISIDNIIRQQQFFYHFDLSALSLNPGNEFEYYFEIWDNDAINGSKSTRSQTMVSKIPTLKEIKENSEENSQKIKQDIEQTIKQVKDLQKSTEQLNKKILEKKKIGWQEEKEIKDLLEKQKQLKEKIENIQKQNEEKNFKEQQYTHVDEDILKKQEELNKLFDELMTDEMKKMFEELEKMLDKLDKDKIKKMLDNMNLENEDIEKQLDRTLEIFKQLEFEKKITETIEKLSELSKKQEKLSKKSLEKKNLHQQDKLSEEQKQINKDFKDIREDIKDLKQKNNELEEPNNLKDTQKQEDDIQQNLDESTESLGKNRNKKASKSQKSASEQMENLSQKFQHMKEEMEKQGLAEDIDALRNILENLIQTSFDQENLMKELKKTARTDPKYIEIIRKQKDIKDNMQMIEDSLFALSKRQVRIKSFVNNEINKINQNIEKTLNILLDMNTIGYTYKTKGQAVSRQQYVMTSVNNLALLLSESLEAMKQAMSQQKSGKGCKCKGKGKPSPGKGKMSIKSMRQLQQQLNKQIEQLKKGMKDGKKGQGQKTMSEQLARLAAQQEAIRRHLQGISQELKKNGQQMDGKISEITKKMEQTETDLVNKIISQQTLKRQQEIIVRLLESEKAEQKRGFEKKRKAEQAKNHNFSNPNNFFKYNKLLKEEKELLKTVPPGLKPFYKNKVNEYLYNFED